MIHAAAFDALLTELEQTADAFWNVGRENAQFLALLLQFASARRVLEVGTSNGYSTLWFARAVLENGGGSVVALEFDAGRAALARTNYERAGLADIITLHEGDARALIPTLPPDERFDFVFLDADKPQYEDYLRAVLPFVRAGGLIVGDDTQSMRDQMPGYVALAFSHPELESVEVPIDDGVILSRKRG